MTRPLTEMEIAERLHGIRCFLLDMDGTIYLGDKLFTFTKSFLDTVQKTGRAYRFFTNNSSKNRQAYLEKLSRMGIVIPPEWMYISNQVAVRVLGERYPGGRMMVLGTDCLIQDFKEAGFQVNTGRSPDAVVLGFDTTITYEAIWAACDAVRPAPRLRCQPGLELSCGKRRLDAGLRFPGQGDRGVHRGGSGIFREAGPPHP